MPEAAWCSTCQKYVWVSLDGRCQFGHGAECLSGRYVDRTPDSTTGQGAPSVLDPHVALAPTDQPARVAITRTRVILTTAFMVVLVGSLTIAAVMAFTSAWTATRNRASLLQHQEGTGGSSATSSSANSKPSSSTLSTEPAAFIPMTAGEWDAYIAEQYPGYRIKQRITVPDQFKKGFLGVNYVLVNKRRPGFTLLVCLTQLAPNQTIEETPEVYLSWVGQIATNDGLFSAHAKRETEYLGDKAQDAIIDGYLANGPSPTAVAFGGFGDEGTTMFRVATGPDAVARVVKLHDGFDYIAETTIPSGPHNGKVSVTVTAW